MMPSIIIHELMRTNEAEKVRATRYAHHRADAYRRPGLALASLLQQWTTKIPVPRRMKTAPAAPTPIARDPLSLAVSRLDDVDIGGVSDAVFPPGRIAYLAAGRLDRKEQS
jgi:hypothetical protein